MRTINKFRTILDGGFVLYTEQTESGMHYGEIRTPEADDEQFIAGCLQNTPAEINQWINEQLKHLLGHKPDILSHKWCKTKDNFGDPCWLYGKTGWSIRFYKGAAQPYSVVFAGNTIETFRTLRESKKIIEYNHRTNWTPFSKFAK